MSTGCDPGASSLLPTIVCYAEVLGFRDMKERAFELGEEREFLERTKRSLAAVYEHIRDIAKFGGEELPVFRLKVFNDNIIVGYPLRYLCHDLRETELGTLLRLCARAAT